jgi:hypothetical protein
MTIMSTEPHSDPVLLGVLLGWKRFPSPTGSIIRLQVAKTMADVAARKIQEHDLALSAIQMRQLGEDLIRAADEREGRRTPTRRRRWWSRQ